MINHRIETDRRRIADAIEVWESEGGTLGREPSMHHLYGRRVEADHSWTVYHVFTGAPACVDQGTMTGLSYAIASARMISLNLRNVSRRKERLTLSPTAPTISEKAAGPL